MYLGVGGAARKLGAKPKDISALLYEGVISETLCPIVAGRRLIPLEVLPTIREMLIARGKLPAEEAAA